MTGHEALAAQVTFGKIFAALTDADQIVFAHHTGNALIEDFGPVLRSWARYAECHHRPGHDDLTAEVAPDSMNGYWSLLDVERV
ncbi:hypothetical protein P3T36_004836 [Kitasatospora sp. MAP12-15]|uniref:hypothetical protein n=1 Tax=unclassified Kitasatospora TaxID=2633591 RepID=UPI00247641F7|nr:hypothetical protein [Kitasatospora sp. MAP12-44]MDH6110232.1 hypothetical protein [Kitasatospora sp. MAP12-44]